MRSSAVAAGDQALATQYNNLRLDAQASSYLLGHEKSTPDMQVAVEAGIGWIGTTLVNYAGGNSSSLVNPVSNPRIDVLTLDSAGTLAWVAGTEAASPSIPTIPTNKIPICAVYLRTSGTTIRDTDQGSGHYIYRDLRVIVANPAESDRVLQLTAHQDLSAGDPVGISNFIDDYVAKAVRTRTAAAHGITSPAMSGSSSHKPHWFCEIGGGKFVHLAYTTAASDTLFAQVGSINQATKTLTLGTAATVGTAVTLVDANMTNVAICKLDTDKFIVFWLEDASTTIIKYIVGTVSGTTISWGSKTTFTTSASALNVNSIFNADQLGTDKGVFMYTPNTATDARVLVFTVSGTTATVGTAATVGTNVDNLQPKRLRKIATDKFVIVTQAAANSIYGQVGTCSGTTITMGSELQLTTTTSSTDGTNFDVVSPATDVFVALFNIDANTSGAIACTVATRTITAGTPYTTGMSMNRGGIFTTSASVFYVGGSSSYTLYKFALSGTTITLTASFTRFNSSGSAIEVGRAIALANGDYIFVDNISDASNVAVWVFGMANNYIGFAQAAASKGNTVNVLVRGVDQNQSGLIAGGFYQVVDGVLTLRQDNTNPGATMVGASNVIQAIGATKVKV